MKKLMIIAMLTAFLAPLVLGGCTSTQNTGSSSYEKSKSGYESKKREGSGGGY
jgi:hypothetical protein